MCCEFPLRLCYLMFHCKSTVFAFQKKCYLPPVKDEKVHKEQKFCNAFVVQPCRSTVLLLMYTPFSVTEMLNNSKDNADSSCYWCFLFPFVLFTFEHSNITQILLHFVNWDNLPEKILKCKNNLDHLIIFLS